MDRRKNTTRLISLAAVLAIAGSASAQTPWLQFAGTNCDIINAANAELVVLESTQNMVIVTGPDVTLSDIVVTGASDIFLNNGTELVPVGFISLELDGSGNETLWWVSLTGNVVDVDGFTGEPTETNMIPTDFVAAPCDACDFWDDASVCEAIIDGNAPAVTIEVCGSSVTVSMIASFAGMSIMGLVKRRRW